MWKESARRAVPSLFVCLVLVVAAASLLSGCGGETAEPEVEEAPSATPSEAAPAEEPEVVFVAGDLVLDAGECTTLEWTTENVVTAYLDGRGVDLTGTEEVCPEETVTYTLTVVSLSGEEVERQVVVEIVAPQETETPTPTATATYVPVTRTPTATTTPTPEPTVEAYVRFYPKNDVYELPAEDLCTEVFWDTAGVTNIELEREGHGRKGVGPKGSEQICFEGDDVRVFLHYTYPDGRPETKTIELSRGDEDDDEDGGDGGGDDGGGDDGGGNGGDGG